jgi:hypothetical protein
MATEIRQLPVARFGEHKFGLNLGVGTSEETIWTGGGLFPWATTWDLGASSIVLQSDDEADTAIGAGARVVKLYGLGGDGLAKTATVTMSGTFTVSAGTWSILFRMNVEAVGASNTNVGEIVALYSSTTVSLIPASGGQTQQAFYQVPEDMKGFVQSIFAYFATGDAGKVSLYTRDAVGKAWRLRFQANVGAGGSIWQLLPRGLVNIDAGSFVELRATGTNASGSEVNGGFDLVLSTEKV